MRHQHWLNRLFLIGLSLSVALPLAAEDEASDVPGTRGAIDIPFELSERQTVSVALYNPQGQVVRFLANALELAPGQWNAAWDGLDMWGRLLPAGTQVEAKIFTHDGIRAFYEFPLAVGDWDPASRPWRSKPTGEGDDMRTGGWLADHSGPASVAVVGDRVIMSSKAPEEGDGLAVLNMDGIKLWGKGGLGVSGPEQIYPINDDDALFVRGGGRFLSIFNTDTMRERRIATWQNQVRVGTSYEGRYWGLLEPLEETNKSFPYTRGRMVMGNSEPQYIGAKPPADYQISNQSRFGGVFTNSNHFQVGIEVPLTNGLGYVVVPWRSDQTLGSLVLERMDAVERVELFVLNDGLTYSPDVHHPYQGTSNEAGDDEFGELFGGELAAEAGLSELDDSLYWTKLGETSVADALNIINAPNAPVSTRAMLLRLTPTREHRRRDRPIWLRRAVPYQVRYDLVEHNGSLALPADLVRKVDRERADGWAFTSIDNINSENKLPVVVDYQQMIEADALVAFGMRSSSWTMDVLTADVAPAEAADRDWQTVQRSRHGAAKKWGDYGARRFPRVAHYEFPETMTIRAIRFTYTGGIARFRDGLSWTKPEPRRVESGYVVPVRLRDVTRELDPRGNQADLVVVDAATGDEISRTTTYRGDFKQLAAAPDGSFWALRGHTLGRARLNGDEWSFEQHNWPNGAPETIRGIWRTGNTLSVCLHGRVALLDASTGSEVGELGGKGEYARGDFHRDQLDRPSVVSIDASGDYWLVENRYHPKRIARFAPDGTCEWTVFGPPEYGGGGYLHPNLETFHYKGMEFSVDLENGRSDLIGFNDRPYTRETPALDGRIFGYTRAGRIIEFNDRTYAVGDPGMVSILEDDVWRPAAVAGGANGSMLLVSHKKPWHQHWMRQDLRGKQFLWNDRNDDGDYQLDEVQLFDSPVVRNSYWGCRIGDDLTMWSVAGRWQPRSYSPTGVPHYHHEDFQPLTMKGRLRNYNGNMRWGSRANPNPNTYGGASLVLGNGMLATMGQPYLMQPDLEVFGGEPDTSGGGDGFQPETPGILIEHPLRYAGKGDTDTEVGEVVVINGNLGQWTIVAGEDRVVLGQLFTGREGGWGSDLNPVRGMEVTHRKHNTETFFGDFTRSHDGRHWIVVGKSHHSLLRVEGLNDISVERQSITVSPEDFASNEQLRPILVQEWEALKAARERKRELAVLPPQERLGRRSPSIDGAVDEWGGPTRMQPIDETYSLSGPTPRMYFDATWTEEGLVLAYCGWNYTGGAASDPRGIFSQGFAIDFRWRSDRSQNREREVIVGDRRLVIGQVEGEWTAVLFDFIDPDDREVVREVFRSPVVETKVGNMRVLGPDEITFRVDPDALLPSVEGDEAGNAALLEQVRGAYFGVEAQREQPFWSAEVLIPWRLLGGKHRSIRGDVGVIGANSGGGDADERRHWASPLKPHPVSDLGAEASIDPRTWGTFYFKNKRDDPNDRRR